MSIPHSAPRPLWINILLYVLGAATVLLSIKPMLNLFSRNQLMNYSYNRFHLVNTYGAFGSVSRERYEVVIEGTDDFLVTHETEWREYQFKAKPGDPKRRPPQIAPYHLRLDWLMWFLQFSVAHTSQGIYTQGYEVWFMKLVQKLLENDRETVRLLRDNPFHETPPKLIRALFYLYRYTNWRERRQSGAWWTRQLIDIYLPPVSLSDLRRRL